MKVLTRLAISWCASLVVSGTGIARADDDAPEPEPRPSPKVRGEIALRAGHGTNPEDDPSNGLDYSIGGRGGLSRSNIYGGMRFDYSASPTASDGFSLSAILVGAEAGYGFVIRDVVTVRPMAGIGDMMMRYHISGLGSGADFSNIYVEPSITVLVDVGLGFFAGADASFMLLPPRSVDSGCPVSAMPCGPMSTPWKAPFLAHLQFGMKF